MDSGARLLASSLYMISSSLVLYARVLVLVPFEAARGVRARPGAFGREELAARRRREACGWRLETGG